jgi:hypothetical protein
VSALLLACPNATLLCSVSVAAALVRSRIVPASRVRVVSSGYSLNLPDRKIAFRLMPVSRDPETLGLLDETTGVLWTADAFGTAVLEPVNDLGELHPAEWREGFSLYHSLIAPQLSGAREAEMRCAVAEVSALRARTMVGAYTPAMAGGTARAALELAQDLSQPWRSSFPSQQELSAFLSRQFDTNPYDREAA